MASFGIPLITFCRSGISSGPSLAYLGTVAYGTLLLAQLCLYQLRLRWFCFFMKLESSIYFMVCQYYLRRSYQFRFLA